MKNVLSGILIILLATGLVAGVTYLISQTISFSMAGGPGEGGGFGGPSGGDLSTDGTTRQSAPQGSQGEGVTQPGDSESGATAPSLPQGDFMGGRGGELEGGSTAGWMQALKNLGIIALVTAGVVVIKKVYEAIRKHGKLAGATAIR